MRASTPLFLSLLLAPSVFMLACDSEGTSDLDGGGDRFDGALGDGEVPPDGAPAPDGSVVVTVCSETRECASDETCFRSRCLPNCGVDVAGFDALIHEGLTPIQHFCRATVAVGSRSLGATVEIWESSPRDSIDLAISRWTLDPTTAQPEPTPVGEATIDVAEGVTVNFAPWLQVNSSGAAGVFAYATDAEARETSLGFSRLGGEVLNVSAPDLGDVTWITETQFIVSASALGGQVDGPGLYVVDISGGTPTAIHIATNVGNRGGSVSEGGGFTLVGSLMDSDDAWPDGSRGPRVFYLPKSTLESAIEAEEPIDVLNSSEVQEVLAPDAARLPSEFRVVHGAFYSFVEEGSVLRYPITFDEDERIGLSEPVVLYSGEVFRDVVAGPARQLLLVHSAGMLLVDQASL